jgi:hypothetical protein
LKLIVRGSTSCMPDKAKWFIGECLENATGLALNKTLHGTEARAKQSYRQSKTDSDPAFHSLFDSHKFHDGTIAYTESGFALIDTLDMINASAQTPREKQIMELLKGRPQMTVAEIATALCCSDGTIYGDIQQMTARLNELAEPKAKDENWRLSFAHNALERRAVELLIKLAKRNCITPFSTVAAELGVNALKIAALNRRIELGRKGAARITSSLVERGNGMVNTGHNVERASDVERPSVKPNGTELVLSA